MRPFAIVTTILFVAGCTPIMTFNADSAETVAPRDRSASRLEHARPDCDSIGTLTFEHKGALADSDIETVADKVASVGGTHYVVRNRTMMARSGGMHAASPVVDVLVCSSATARNHRTTDVR
jgi:hypothetical protein